MSQMSQKRMKEKRWADKRAKKVEAMKRGDLYESRSRAKKAKVIRKALKTHPHGPCGNVGCHQCFHVNNPGEQPMDVVRK